jgi:DNA repair ATPase RecN
LERLTERHEALGQSLELMQAQWQANAEETDKQIRALVANSEETGNQIRTLTQGISSLLQLAAKHDSQWDEIALSTARLVHTAELHQQQLDAHDDRLDNLEGT